MVTVCDPTAKTSLPQSWRIIELHDAQEIQIKKSSSAPWLDPIAPAWRTFAQALDIQNIAASPPYQASHMASLGVHRSHPQNSSHSELLLLPWIPGATRAPRPSVEPRQLRRTISGVPQSLNLPHVGRLNSHWSRMALNTCGTTAVFPMAGNALNTFADHTCRWGGSPHMGGSPHRGSPPSHQGQGLASREVARFLEEDHQRTDRAQTLGGPLDRPCRQDAV